jgi:phosphoribosylaminoimidazole-succinocarboxamide synthase
MRVRSPLPPLPPSPYVSPPLSRPFKVQVLPEAPADLVAELSRRYIMLFEKITQQTFRPASPHQDPGKRIRENLAKAGL